MAFGCRMSPFGSAPQTVVVLRRGAARKGIDAGGVPTLAVVPPLIAGGVPIQLGGPPQIECGAAPPIGGALRGGGGGNAMAGLRGRHESTDWCNRGGSCVDDGDSQSRSSSSSSSHRSSVLNNKSYFPYPITLNLL